MEIWDIYDENRKLTGRKHVRGEAMQSGDYHLVVEAWIVDSTCKFLIPKRASSKEAFPNLWEPSGGSAIASEDSLTAIMREIKEETGIDIVPENGKLLTTIKREREIINDFKDVWLFCCEFNLEDVVLRRGETVEARKVTWSEINEMMKYGRFMPKHVFPYFDLLETMPKNFDSN